MFESNELMFCHSYHIYVACYLVLLTYTICMLHWQRT